MDFGVIKKLKKVKWFQMFTLSMRDLDGFIK